MTMLAARSSSMVYILERVAGSQQNGMGIMPSGMSHALKFLHYLVMYLCKISRLGFAHSEVLQASIVIHL